MSDREQDGLTLLVEELENPDWPSPDLLARYATAPNSLDATERDEIERAIGMYPEIVDELDTLRGFDFRRLDADRETTTATSGLTGWIAAIRRSPITWGITAAALLLLTWLTLRVAPLGEPPSEPSIASRDSEPERRHQPPVLDETHETVTPREPGPQDLAHGDTQPSPELDPARTTDDSTHAPDDSALQLAQPDRAGSSPIDSPQAPSPSEPPRATPDSGAGELSAAPREIQLAMRMPTYQPAFGVEPPGGLSDWTVRSNDEFVMFKILSPRHETRTTRADPTLFWQLDRITETGGFYLTILDQDGEPIALDVSIPRPQQPGLQHIELSTLGIALPTGGTLRWSIAHRLEPEAPPTRFDVAWLRHAPLAPEAAQQLATTAQPQHSALFAAAGCYNEALEAALEARDTRPDDSQPRRAVEILLQAGAE